MRRHPLLVQTFGAAARGGALGATLLLAPPATALAQAVPLTPTALIGTWAEEGTKAVYMHFQADSTLVMGPNAYRWRLRHDTLVVDSTLRGQSWGIRYLTEFDGQRLLLWVSNKARARVLVRAAPAAVDWAFDRAFTGRALPCKDGLILNLMDCHNVELLAFLPQDSIAHAGGGDLWGWTDSATGREFAITSGITGPPAVVEVTDPLHPRYLGTLAPHSGSPSVASIKVYQHYAFVGYEGSDPSLVQLQVFDLTRLRAARRPQTFPEAAYFAGAASAHTIALNPATGFAYINGGVTCGGLHMVDFRDPLHPTTAGCHVDLRLGRQSGYMHDSQCVLYHGPDRRYQGREICVAYAGDVIGILDVTDKQHPQTLSVVSYPNAVAAHQGWFTADQRYIYLDDEFDEMAIGHTRTIGFDLTDLTDPILSTEFLHTTRAIDHNLYIDGRYMYQGNYEAGFRAIDITDPKQLKEVGYLSNIGTAWGTYPFFKNGVVAVSTSQGFWLVRLQPRLP